MRECELIARADFRREKRYCVIILAAAMCACWIIPLRLACSGPFSYYMLGYVCDEFTYAQRVQPLMPGATRTNPLNGIGDRDTISPYFLEDGVRAVITMLGADPVACIWVWRVLMPCAIAVALWFLAKACVPSRKDGSSAILALALAAAAFPMLYVVYDLLSVASPFQFFINRFPTNIEYPLSVLTAFAYVRFLALRNFKFTLLLVLLGICMIYLRPYAAMPWGITLAAGYLWPAIQGQIRWRKVWLAAGAVAVALIPLILVSKYNRQSIAYNETLTRYLKPEYYAIHPRSILYISIGCVLVAGSFLLRRRFRMIGATFALPLFVLPFVCGHTEFCTELSLDRFAVFYLPALLCVAMLAGIRFVTQPRFRLQLRTVIERICGGGLLMILALTAKNSLYNFESFGPYLTIRQELPCVTGYHWLRDHTAPDALILADDGFDWSILINEKQVAIVWEKAYPGHEDLFSLACRRKRLYSSRLYGNILTNADEIKLRAIYLGTFGVPIAKDIYASAIKQYTPDYVFWRKDAKVGRGYGAMLRAACEPVYSDESCEIWKLDRSKLDVALSVN